MIKTIHGILLILYIIVCVALTVVVILQEGKQDLQELSAELLSLIGEKTKDVLWKADLLWLQEFLQYYLF